MYLIFDLGNTNKKMVVLPAGELTAEEFSGRQDEIISSPEISLQSVREFTSRYPSIRASIVSSVVPFPASVAGWLR